MLPALSRLSRKNKIFMASRYVARKPSGVQDLHQLLEAPLVGVMLSQVRARFQHCLPVHFGTAHHVREAITELLARRQRKGRFAVNLAHRVPGKHRNRNRVGAEGLEGAVSDQAQFLEQWPVKDWTELGLPHKFVHLVKRDSFPSLDAEAVEQDRVNINALKTELGCPLRTPRPVPTD